MTLSQALHGLHEDSENNPSWRAVEIRLQPAIPVPGPGFTDERSDSAVIVENGSRDTLFLFGTPTPRRLKIKEARVYDGWGVKGNPFHLRQVEC